MQNFSGTKSLAQRPRRLRSAPWLRSLVQEHALRPQDLILPVFVQAEAGKTAIEALPGVYRYGLDLLPEVAKKARDLGIPALALFPVVPASLKDPTGQEALSPDNLIGQALQMLKAAVPEIGLIADVALDPYTSHGHDGLLNADGQVDNDATVQQLCRQALALATAGADVVAPSDMMDGRIAAIRQTLDQHQFQGCSILSYTAKYASAFYGPFRSAVGSDGALKGDKRTYQMDPANSREARREAALDQAEAADMLMVKPGLPYLDVLAQLKQTSLVPVLAYQVSGEYAMLKHAASAGAFDFQQACLESLLCFKRAGADGILTYAACEVAACL